MSEPAPETRCPICGKPTTTRYKPFCSPRCVQLDLGRWLDGSYRVETDESSEDQPDAAG
ncbi:MAG TPA: DNA gyrase inhibitor YacG [Stellaceae bacterium]|nr:DNA gyrase inhibitor YacG [Stellaceae bacterium]